MNFGCRWGKSGIVIYMHVFKSFFCSTLCMFFYVWMLCNSAWDKLLCSSFQKLLISYLIFICGLQQLAFCISTLANCMVISWDSVWMMVFRIVSQSAPLRKACVFICLIRCLFVFPQRPLKLSVPGNNYMFPRGSPNIQGIRRHLACKSLFLSLTLCIAFYFLLSSAPSILSASQLYKHSVSLL